MATLLHFQIQEASTLVLLLHAAQSLMNTPIFESQQKNSRTAVWQHRIHSDTPSNCKHLPINFYQQQYQKQMAKVKSKFIDNDEL